MCTDYTRARPRMPPSPCDLCQGREQSGLYRQDAPGLLVLNVDGGAVGLVQQHRVSVCAYLRRPQRTTELRFELKWGVGERSRSRGRPPGAPTLLRPVE
ncbi:unnamed protein product [Tetraodon nigroviridis]|uniref:(spotted green pufferfish) hypothetical protein n=1 Tax=Tetraodon nigroviridis TaxID=99883 RepID=Q4SRV6_TETNG|nr:unnamed protein product [Tetraodon nigroviridis]